MMDSLKLPWSRRWPWLKFVFAPLLGLSLGLHGVLLLAPVPPNSSTQEDASPESTEEESTVDLLSISRLATTAPPSGTAPPAPAPAPVPPAVPPPRPVAPAPYPADLPPPVPPADAPALDEASPEPVAAEPPPAEVPPANESAVEPGFDANRQAQLVGSALGGLGRAPGSSNFDLTDQFPGDIWDLYISRWDEGRKACFFSAIDGSSYALRPPALDLRYLSRNSQLVAQQDIPRTFAEQAVQPLGEVYCGANLFEIQDNGAPMLWVSLVPVSPGGSTTLVIFWQADPRL